MPTKDDDGADHCWNRLIWLTWYVPQIAWSPMGDFLLSLKKHLLVPCGRRHTFWGWHRTFVEAAKSPSRSDTVIRGFEAQPKTRVKLHELILQLNQALPASIDGVNWDCPLARGGKGQSLRGVQCWPRTAFWGFWRSSQLLELLRQWRDCHLYWQGGMCYSSK